MQMNLDFREIFTVGMVLFAVIDIVGTIPVVVDLRTKHGHIESGKASIVAGIIMLVFLFIGEEFLKLIGIDVHSFAVAGSFVLFFWHSK
jgi:multiple antibiotic resistance protein